MCLPPKASWTLCLGWDRDVVPKGPVRMRLGLDGVFKSIIEIG